jgi:hypothetical protein
MQAASYRMSMPSYESPPLLGKRAPRCPPYLEITQAEQLLPYLEEVAKRPYNQGLHACWDLRPGERVLLRVDNWHDPLVIEACRQILEKYGCQYEIQVADRGPIPAWEGHNEVEYYLARTKELADWMDQWEKLANEGKYDKVLWGYGGPILRDDRMKIQRMPFITPEMLASPAHTLPWELLDALDRWVWERVRKARVVRIVDPEGTDITFVNQDGYYDQNREKYNAELVGLFWKGNEKFGETYLPGHIGLRPWLFLPNEESEGVIAGTMNHIGPVPWIALRVKNSRIVEIREGGMFGEKLRKLMEETDGLEYPGMPGKGLFWWWEASMGTNPHIHRPRQQFLTGLVNCLYERMRSGVIHMGFGTIISSAPEKVAAQSGLPVGHWHVHLYFPTVFCEMPDGVTEILVEDGHLRALDEPGIRRIAEKYGDPDLLLSESWVPAVPGINVTGDYRRDYAEDPTAWTLVELQVCRRWHHLFMEMVGGDHVGCTRSERLWHGGRGHGCG